MKKQTKQETQGYICPQTKLQCRDECCVSAEDCHIEAGFGIISDCEPPKQETLENLKNQLKKVIKEHPICVNEDTYWRGVKIGLETTIALAESLLNKEKEQIIDAHFEGQNDETDGCSLDISEQYYNETFNTNEK